MYFFLAKENKKSKRTIKSHDLWLFFLPRNSRAKLASLGQPMQIHVPFFPPMIFQVFKRPTTLQQRNILKCQKKGNEVLRSLRLAHSVEALLVQTLSLIH